MPREMRIYFEGHKNLKAGFDAFLREIKERARTAQWNIRIIATGPTPERDFGIALRKHPGASNILLRDSEGPHRPGLSAEVCQKQGWPSYQADLIFWMVQMMESWFHADKEALERYYGNGFHRSALTANPNVEEISKQDLINGLNAATRNATKGKYHKTKHAPAILGLIDPARVQQAAPNCKRFFQAVLGILP